MVISDGQDCRATACSLGSDDTFTPRSEDLGDAMATACIDTLGCCYDQMVRTEELEGNWAWIIERIESMAS